MSDTKEFAFNSKTLRAMMIENEPWFVGTDVAKILCYGDPHGAINKHVNEKDKMKCPIDIRSTFTNYRARKSEVIMLNEKGLDSLNTKSRFNKDTGFKIWIANVVIPTMCKTDTESLDKDSIDVKETYIDKSLASEIQSINAKARMNNSIAKKASAFLKLSQSDCLNEAEKRNLVAKGANVLAGENLIPIN